MAEFKIRNTLNPYKVIKCTLTFRQLINKGEEGEPVWLVELSTVEPHKDGGKINPVYVHYTSASNLDKAISEGVAIISEQVDWSPLLDDTSPPFIAYYTPGGAISSINSDVNIGIKEQQPSTGININTIRMSVNGFDVTDDIEISGDPFAYSITWRPRIRVHETE